MFRPRPGFAHFRTEMTRFFVDRANVIERVERRLIRVFNRFGHRVRTFARDKVLKTARRQKLSELSDGERQEYRDLQAAFRAGRLREKPVLPDISAKPGDPPLLHAQKKNGNRRNSPLRKRLFYGIDPSTRSLLVGPETFSTAKGNSVPEKLERGNHPFMSVALEEELPTLRQMLKG